MNMTNKVRPVSFALPNSIVDMLDALNLIMKESKSEIIRKALEDYFKNHLDSNTKKSAEKILKVRADHEKSKS